MEPRIPDDLGAHPASAACLSCGPGRWLSLSEPPSLRGHSGGQPSLLQAPRRPFMTTPGTPRRRRRDPEPGEDKAPPWRSGGPGPPATGPPVTPASSWQSLCRRGRPARGPSSVLTRSKLAASKVRQTHRDSGTHAAKSACEGAGRRRSQGCRENWSEARAPASALSRGAPHPISLLDRHSKPRFMEGSSEMERRHPRIWGRGRPPHPAPCLPSRSSLSGRGKRAR